MSSSGKAHQACDQAGNLDHCASGAVECLGLLFSSHTERRAHFLGILREKLQEPVFRQRPGFPRGSDEDILRLSDPPYYTACPNPFVQDFLRHYGRPYDPAAGYSREPLASDTGAGKTHAVYTAHAYHSKIPHLATIPCVLHYTAPGDVVLDGFAGSGMTGVAAQLCGSSEQEVRTLFDPSSRSPGTGSAVFGERGVLLAELSPVASFVAYNLNVGVDAGVAAKAGRFFFNAIDDELSWMYKTQHSRGKGARIRYTVWSQVVLCDNCGFDVNYFEHAYDTEQKKFRSEVTCPGCGMAVSGKDLARKLTTSFDPATQSTMQRSAYEPVLLEYGLPGTKSRPRRVPNEMDRELLATIEKDPIRDWYPTDPLPLGRMRDSKHLEKHGITRFHHFYLPRPLRALGAMWRIASEYPDHEGRRFLQFMVQQCFWGMTVQNRYGGSFYSQVNRYLGGVYYVPPICSESAPWLILDGKYKRLLKLLQAGKLPTQRRCLISTESIGGLPVGESTIDYIYTDPPFGDAIKYGDLNLLLEAWHRLSSQLDEEVLWDKAKGKDLATYTAMMRDAFAVYRRSLKPGRWITVVFHNSKNVVWTAIQEALGNAGFVVADVRTLDRKQGTFNQVTAARAVKQDLVISAYRPEAALEEKFQLASGTENGVWEFTTAHLRQLPIFTSRNGACEPIAERQHFLLFDRMVAFHVQRGVTVPLSAGAFYEGLTQRYSERDGMYFLPEQVAEYDRKRLTVKDVLQLELFVRDEESAIQWLKQQLTKKPQTFQEIHPHFTKEMAGWRKHEKRPELLHVLQENFLCCDSKGEVPSQIHSYLSSNFKELRSLAKTDSALRAKAKDRWYVPDPRKAGDLEKVRERALLREFEEYRETKQKRLKVFRLEAVRAGFKRAWQEREYATIIGVARKIPEKVLQEDPKLLMWFDQAITRTSS
ncbi:DNA methyltransferase [Planctomycetota bacterium]